MDQNPENLDRLIRGAKDGDQGALADLYTLFFPKIYRFLYFRTSHRQTAEDLAEDVFVKAYASLGSFRSSPGAFPGWLYQVARNHLVDHYRKSRPAADLSEIESWASYEDSALDQASLSSDQRVLLGELTKLPEDQRRVIALRFYEQLETDEIASVMDITEGAVRVLQHRAIQKLKDLIDHRAAH